MTSVVGRFSKIYGSGPGHLLLMTAGFAVLAAAVATMTPAALWNAESWWQSIAVWFVIAIIAHDLIAFPLYAVADRALQRGTRAHNGHRSAAVNYVRIPSMAATLTLLVFLPGIIEQGGPAYQAATGQTQGPFLTRWLWLTATFFAISAVTFGLRSLRRRVTTSPPHPPKRGRHPI